MGELAIKLCWGAFLCVWTVGAIYNFFYAPATERRAKLTIGITWLIGLLVFGSGSATSFPNIWTALMYKRWWIEDMGIVILLLATAFVFWARWVLGTMWSAQPVAKVSHELRTAGPYAITRNPIYTGLLGMLLGTAFITGFGIFSFVFLAGVVLFYIKIYHEEQILLAKFGNEFRNYMDRVPRLLPMPFRQQGKIK